MNVKGNLNVNDNIYSGGTLINCQFKINQQ